MSRDSPAHLESDVVLRDGSTVHVRPARREDRLLVEDYLLGMSDETRRLRFWSQAIDVRGLAEKIVDVDPANHLTLLVLHGGAMIGGAQYARTDERRAEVSLSVTDAWQGRGIGSILLGHLAQAGARAGITTFVAEVLPENHRMINVFRSSGFPVSIRALPGSIDVEFPITLTPDAIAHFERRETEASVNAMRTFLTPASIAVVGASRDRSSIGGTLFHNLITSGFDGPVYPVNPKADVVHSVPAYPTIEDAPGPVALAFVCVPAPLVLDVAAACGRAGVRGLVVISAGFAEVGGAGIERQHALLETCRANGMRLIGPNCMGIVNTAADLNGTFATVYPPAGRVGFLSQSGALGLAVMQHASQIGLGLSSFVSVGNKADVSSNDLVAYWDEDDGTDVMLLYLESFGNPRRFARLARDVARRKPIVVVKSGRGSAGKRAAASHTGALLAASDVTIDALFRQSGVIRTSTLGEMFDVATLLANQPVPRGDRVAILTNAGGLGILCADTCEANGLRVDALSEATASRLREFLPGEASVGNPVDMIASATAEDYGRAIGVVADDPDVDAMIVIYIPPQIAFAAEILAAIEAAIADVGDRMPIALTYMSPEDGRRDDDRPAGGRRIPRFAFPEDAAIAMARAGAYGRWRERPAGTVPAFADVRTDAAYSLVADALARGGGWLTDEEIAALLGCYGVPLARSERVATPDEAAAAAGRIGGAVALKALGPAIVHKTELGAVRLDLATADDVRAAAERMRADVASAGVEVNGFLVQEMVRDGVQMLVGVAHDRLFGPVIACSAGGTAVELVRDVAVSVTPITDVDAAEMVRSLKTYPLLTGFRGAPPADVAALEEIVLRVGALVDAHPSVAEMDCNPVMVRRDGAVVVDARIRVEPPPPERPLAARAAPDA